MKADMNIIETDDAEVSQYSRRQILPLKEIKVETKPKNISFFKLFCYKNNIKEKILLAIAFITAIMAGITFPAFGLLLGEAINTLGRNSQEDKIESVSAVCVMFLYIGIFVLVSNFLSIFLFGLHSYKLSQKIREDYFKTLMKQEQNYFDNMNPFELSTKIDQELKTIESGVKFFLIL